MDLLLLIWEFLSAMLLDRDCRNMYLDLPFLWKVYVIVILEVKWKDKFIQIDGIHF